MSSTSNQLNQSSTFLANKPRNEVNEQGEIFRIDGNTTFVKMYGSWWEEHKRLICEIESALDDHNHQDIDEKLRFLIDIVMKHYVELFEMKTSVANVAEDHVFNVGSAIWCTTAERNLWWIGGFSPSELLQVILPQLQHLCSLQQLHNILILGESCQQAEDALSQGLQKLHQNKGFQLTYLPQQIIFLKQADQCRLEFLHQLCGFLTISQQAQFLLALGKHLHNPQPWSSL